jgi:hypothetical protein
MGSEKYKPATQRKEDQSREEYKRKAQRLTQKAALLDPTHPQREE